MLFFAEEISGLKLYFDAFLIKEKNAASATSFVTVCTTLLRKVLLMQEFPLKIALYRHALIYVTLQPVTICGNNITSSVVFFGIFVKKKRVGISILQSPSYSAAYFYNQAVDILTQWDL